MGLSILSQTFDFADGEQGWTHGFSDYPLGDSSRFQFQYDYNDSIGSKAVMLSGNNLSDDLFMFLKKKVTGLTPDTDFTLTFEVDFASNARAGLVGVGGAPGESVYMKVGASSIEPKAVIDDKMYVMNIDKGDQSQGGANMIPIGNIAIPNESTGFVTITRNNSSYNGSPLVVRSNSKGELWLIIGTDSGYEGTTTLFYKKVKVALSSSY